jgi:hypothetical protein
VGSEAVVFHSPPFDQDLGLQQRIEQLPVQELRPELFIAGFDIALLRRAAGFDEQQANTQVFQPLANSRSCELSAIVAADEIGCPLLTKEVRQALPRELVDHHEHPVLAAIVGGAFDEVVGSRVVLGLRAKTNAGSVVQPQPSHG